MSGRPEAVDQWAGKRYSVLAGTTAVVGWESHLQPLFLQCTVFFNFPSARNLSPKRGQMPYLRMRRLSRGKSSSPSMS